MKGIWVVIANKSEAHIFETIGNKPVLRFLKDLMKPEGRLHNRDLVTDRPGRLFSSGGNQDRRHGAGGSEPPKEHLAEEFGREIAAVLEHGFNHNEFDRLILVADPHFLGRIKEALPNNISKRVVATMAKNLSYISREDMPRYVEDLVRDALRPEMRTA